jgi:hypothetical protein
VERQQLVVTAQRGRDRGERGQDGHCPNPGGSDREGRWPKDT